MLFPPTPHLANFAFHDPSNVTLFPAKRILGTLPSTSSPQTPMAIASTVLSSHFQRTASLTALLNSSSNEQYQVPSVDNLVPHITLSYQHPLQHTPMESTLKTLPEVLLSQDYYSGEPPRDDPGGIRVTVVLSIQIPRQRASRAIYRRWLYKACHGGKLRSPCLLIAMI